MTAVDRCLGHVRGTAGEDGVVHHGAFDSSLDGRVRPVLGNRRIVGKPPGGAAAPSDLSPVDSIAPLMLGDQGPLCEPGRQGRARIDRCSGSVRPGLGAS
jgi:hypothetical protein